MAARETGMGETAGSVPEMLMSRICWCNVLWARGPLAPGEWVL